MNAAHNGGPAFPTANGGSPDDGMDLRDYFAVHADIGDVDQLSAPVGVVLLGRDVPEFRKDGTGCYAWWAEYRAKLRYIEADAMLKERAK